MRARILIWSVTAALAGFLFGFDTVVISGAEETIQSLWQLSPVTHGLAISMALWGTVLGSMLGGVPTERFGRKPTLITIGVLYFFSAIWSAFATDIYSFMIARFIGGVGVGVSTVAAPLYISEISPSKHRGWLAGLFQFNIVFGILVALISNSLISNLGDQSWRWMLGAEAVPAIVFFVMCFSLPRSPRWLITAKNDHAAARETLAVMNPDLDAQGIESLAQAIGRAPSESSGGAGFWSAQLRKPITLAFLIAFFNQLSGINIIMYFTPRLLGLAGFEDPFTVAISLGMVNLLFTMLGLFLIDRLGRRSLLLIGSVGYIVSLGICGGTFLSNPDFQVVSKIVSSARAVIKSAEAVEELTIDGRAVSDDEKKKAIEAFGQAKLALAEVSDVKFAAAGSGTAAAIEMSKEVKQAAAKRLGFSSMVVLLSLLGFIASHAIGQGAVIWVFISEIFPNAHRATGQALGCFTHWIFAAGLTLLFPIAIANIDAGWLFLFFCGMMVLQLFWVLLKVPETKGVSLEAIQEKLGVE